MSSDLDRALRFPIASFVLDNADDLTRGLLIVGSTGSGKTNDALWIAAALTDLGVPTLVIDVKREYRRLLGVVDARERVAVVPAERFAFNPLRPPKGVGALEWTQVFAETFAYEFGLSEPSKAILYWAAEGLREEGGPMTLRALYERVEGYRPRSEGEANSRASVLNRLYLLDRGPLGAALSAEEGHDVGDLLERTLVLELGPTMDVSVQSFLMGILIAHVYAYLSRLPRTAGPKDRLRYAIVVEEAHRVLGERRPEWMAGRRSFIERAVAEGREFGLGFVLIDQMPSQLSAYAVANCNTIIAHRLVGARDHEEMVRVLRLMGPVTGPAQQRLLGSMPDGYAIVKLLFQETVPRWMLSLPEDERSPWRTTFVNRTTELVRVPLIKRRAPMPSDREVEEHMERHPLRRVLRPRALKVRGRRLVDLYVAANSVFGSLVAFQAAWSMFDGPKTYEELGGLTGTSRSAVSKHVTKMVRVGIVERRRTGREYECGLTRKGRALLEGLYLTTTGGR